MGSLLLKNASHVALMDDAGSEVTDQSIYCKDGVISAMGALSELPQTADKVLDLQGMTVIPGLINTHHHLFQNLTRVVPQAQNVSLFGWLKTLYPIWQRLRPEHIYAAVAVGLAELALSGCTTSSDHQYLFPNGSRLDDAIEAAGAIGMRFHASRGSMSIGESQGGLPPDALTEDEAAILKDSERVIAQFHDPRRYAMTRVVIAPCSPFSVSRELMRDSALLAREKKVRLHTHLAENVEDIDYSMAHFNMRPGDYVASLDWLGSDVWHAHCVQLNSTEIDLFATSGTGVAHCPCSNMRLASGIAPLRAMLDAGVAVGLGVDGSASSDSGHMLNEARQAMLLQRVLGGAASMQAREALRLATRGGAAVLGRDDIGQIALGQAADFAIYNMNCIDFSGSHTDPIAALVFCGPVKTTHTIINGQVVVEDGRLTRLDTAQLLARHSALARGLFNHRYLSA